MRILYQTSRHRSRAQPVTDTGFCAFVKICPARADCRARAFPRRPCGVERGNDYEFQKRKVHAEVPVAGLAGKWSVLSDGGRGAELIRNSLDLKEIQDNEEHNADERQKRVRDRLDKIRETILNADLKEIKHGAKNLKSSYNNEKREQQQKEGLLRLFDVMRKTGADRDKTIVRLSKGYKLKKSSAERFYDRGLAMIKVLLNP